MQEQLLDQLNLIKRHTLNIKTQFTQDRALRQA